MSESKSDAQEMKRVTAEDRGWKIVSHIRHAIEGGIDGIGAVCEVATVTKDEEKFVLKQPIMWYEVDYQKIAAKIGAAPNVVDSWQLWKKTFTLVAIVMEEVPSILGMKMEPEVLWPIAKSLFKQLAGIHSCGILHLDIAPANCGWWPESGRTCILDYGHALFKNRFAYSMHPLGRSAYASTYYHRYHSDEKKKSHPLDDYEALVYTLLKCTLGKLPWESESDDKVLRKMKRKWAKQDPISQTESSLQCMVQIIHKLLRNTASETILPLMLDCITKKINT